MAAKKSRYSNTATRFQKTVSAIHSVYAGFRRFSLADTGTITRTPTRAHTIIPVFDPTTIYPNHHPPCGVVVAPTGVFCLSRRFFVTQRSFFWCIRGGSMVLFVNLPILRYAAFSIHPAIVRRSGGGFLMFIAQTSLLGDGLPCWSGCLGLFFGFFYRRLGCFYRRLGCLYRHIVGVFLAFLRFFLYLCTIIIKGYCYGKV